jgi:DNA polymerase III delta subunit
MTLENKTKPPAPFTLLMGDDTFSREKARDDAFSAFSPQSSDVAIERFDPGSQSFAAFLEHIVTPSLFSTIRFFLVREAHLLAKTDFDQLNDVFSFDIPDVYVVIETDKTRTKKGRGQAMPKELERWVETFAKKAEERPDKFSIIDFVMPPDYKMSQWLATRTPLLVGRSISQKDAEYLIECTGTDSSTLYSELQKLDLFLPPDCPIDRASIEAVSGATRLMTQFELAQSLGKKDFPKVLEIIDSLYTGSVYVPLYISAIFKHFWALFRIAIYEKAHPEDIRQFAASMKRFNKAVQDEIGHKIGMAAGLLSDKQRSSVYPVIVKSDVVQQSKSFTEDNYKKIFKWLGDYDIGIKTGRVGDDKTGFQLLCYKIFRVGELENT